MNASTRSLLSIMSAAIAQSGELVQFVESRDDHGPAFFDHVRSDLHDDARLQAAKEKRERRRARHVRNRAREELARLMRQILASELADSEELRARVRHLVQLGELDIGGVTP